MKELSVIQELLSLRAERDRLADEVEFLRALVLEAVRRPEPPPYSQEAEAIRRYMGAA